MLSRYTNIHCEKKWHNVKLGAENLQTFAPYIGVCQQTPEGHIWKKNLADKPIMQIIENQDVRKQLREPTNVWAGAHGNTIINV